MSTAIEKAAELAEIINLHTKRDLVPAPQTPSGQAPEKLLYTIPEVASALAVGPTTVKQLIRDGRLRSVLICGARRIPVEAVRELAQRGTE
jgi:excisionase family DNA binding protein